MFDRELLKAYMAGVYKIRGDTLLDQIWCLGGALKFSDELLKIEKEIIEESNKFKNDVVDIGSIAVN